jgi:hypothetical protein
MAQAKKQTMIGNVVLADYEDICFFNAFSRETTNTNEELEEFIHNINLEYDYEEAE